MPLVKFKTKEEIPAEKAGDALKLEDGSYVLSEDPDTSDLENSLNEERTKREAAEKNAQTAARKLKGLENRQKAEESGIDEATRQAMRSEWQAEHDAETREQREAAARAFEENKQLKRDRLLENVATSEAGGVRPERLSQWMRLNGHHYELTVDGKGLVVKGKPGADVAKHVMSLKTAPDSMPECYVGSQIAGSGAHGSTGVTGGAGDISFEDLMKNPSKGLQAANQAAAK